MYNAMYYQMQNQPGYDPSKNMNVFEGDITIINHQNLNDPMTMQAQMMYGNIMGALMNTMGELNNRKLAIEQELEQRKLELDYLNVSPELEQKSSNELPTSLKNKLIADVVDAEFEVVDAPKENNSIEKISISNTIYRTLEKINDDDIIKDLSKQESNDKTPELFSNNDGESVIVSFILLKNNDWRSSVKQSILELENPSENFFKEDQEYLFFIYENAKSIKADSAILITPTTINSFLSLENENVNIKNYCKEDLLAACERYTDNVYRIIEPIVPSSSDISKLFGKDDFKYSYVTINPLYSESIDEVNISVNLASKSTIKITKGDF